MHDPRSVASWTLPVAADVPVLVVGAGPAGVAAALEAAGRGLGVMLVDEHPLDPALFGLDVPLHFGGCTGGAVRSPRRMLERVAAAAPGLEEAVERGVDVRLGTTVWGLFAHGPGTRWLPPGGVVAGLADAERAWQVRCRRAIVAAGRRDAGLAFEGWGLPGVAGAAALRCLLDRYDAFEGRRLVVLGSDADGLDLVRDALSRGLEVAAVVEIGPEPLGPRRLVDLVRGAGVPILTRTMVAAARGASRVERVATVALDVGGRPVPGSGRELACDTVALAPGAVPAVELLAALGCALEHRGPLGGWVPRLDEGLRTSVPGVSAAGDVAGVHAAKTLDPEIARAEGRIAALAAAQDLGVFGGPAPAAGCASFADGPDVAEHRAAWVGAALAVSGPEVAICQCEEVAAREILEVRAPRYLGADPARVGGPHILGLLAAPGAAADQDQVKRLTRAGMGVCQGRRCREQIAALLAREAGLPVASCDPATYRPPVRPLPLAVLAERDEPPDGADGWHAWFGIPEMWVPYWRLGSDARQLEPVDEG
jgi:thioredoxin reductase